MSQPGPRVPRHVAIIMDGNGRWARARGLPRPAGHRAAMKVVRNMVEECSRRGVAFLTLFAFSSENWQRPREEVGTIMGLFLDALDREVADLHRNQVRLRFIGARETLAVKLAGRMASAERLTAGNSGLTLQVAISYGGRWDIVRAARHLALEAAAGRFDPAELDEGRFAAQLALAGTPDPDLLIRTGGEQRISNFLLWNLAYSELFFCDVLWPAFTVEHLQAAFDQFAARERRFGMTSAQIRAGDA